MEGRKVMNMKRFIALIMAFVMVLLVSVPVYAGSTDTYTITINSDKSGHTYEAYQIFAGEVSADKTTLSDITWGSGVDSSSYDAIYSALAAITVTSDTDTYYPFTNTPTASGGSALTSAADVAAALAAYPDAAEDFAQVISQYLSTTHTDSTETTSLYTIDVTGSGYYLIEDADGSVTTAGDAYTDIILEVVADVTATSKSVYPSVTKSVDNEDVSIGDPILYTLTGYIPDTSAYTNGYTYIFHDTLASGLDCYSSDPSAIGASVYTPADVSSDFDQSTTYYIVNSDGELVATTDSSPVTGTTYYTQSSLGYSRDYTVSIDDSNKATTGTAITVTIVDAEQYSKSYVVVVYTAKLNSYAVIGNDGNTNSVKVTYSNNPNVSDPTTATNDTPNAEVVTFTYELDVTKIDGSTESNPTPTTLENAEFVLYRYQSDGTTIEYVTVDSDNKVTGWTTTEPSTATFVTGTDGKISVIGLDEGTYYLKETKAPDGYNSITSPIKIEIVATLEDTDNDGLDEVKSLTVEVDNGGTVETTDTDKGSVSVTVKNNAGSVMPSTGGIGVTVYVVGGLVLIVAALGVLMAVKVKGKKNGN